MGFATLVWALKRGINEINEKPVVAQRYKCRTVNATGCGFDPRGNEIFIFILYFYVFALVSRQKRGVEFGHSPRYTSRIPLEVSSH